MVATPTAPEPHRKHIRPLGPNAHPWVGEHSQQHPEAPHRWAIIRCVDPCGAPGIAPGAEYLVRADFVHDQ